MEIMLRNLHAHGGEEGEAATPLLIGIKVAALWVIWVLGFIFGLLPFFM